MNALTPLAVTAEPLLRAIQAGACATPTELAIAADRSPKNIARDLTVLENDGLIDRDALTLTELGASMLAALDRANGAPDGAILAEGFTALPHHSIQPDLLNPRRAFDDDALAELANSIAAQGLMQNLVVRPDAPLADGSPCALHRLVSGERRWRAIGLLIDRGDWPADRLVPVQIRAMDDNDHALAALVENLQRVDLNPLEEAQAFERLVAGHGWSTADVADKVAKTQRFVQQRLQLNQLNDKEKAMLLAGELSVGEARKRLANRPEPLVLTPAQALVVAEVIAAMGDEVSAYRRIECDPVAIADPVLSTLQGRGLLYAHGPDRATGIYKVEFVGWSGFEQIKIHHPDLFKPANLLAVRAAAAGSDAAEQADTEGRYLTPWLNGPFELTPEGQACVEAAALAAEAHRQEQDRQDAIFKASQQECVAVNGRANDLVAAMTNRQWEAEAVAKTLEDTGARLPWRFVEPEHPDQPGQLLDANNQQVDLRAWSGGILANVRIRLVMAAVNSAADLDPAVVSHAEHEALLEAQRAQTAADAEEQEADEVAPGDDTDDGE